MYIHVFVYADIWWYCERFTYCGRLAINSFFQSTFSFYIFFLLDSRYIWRIEMRLSLHILQFPLFHRVFRSKRYKSGTKKYLSTKVENGCDIKSTLACNNNSYENSIRDTLKFVNAWNMFGEIDVWISYMRYIRVHAFHTSNSNVLKNTQKKKKCQHCGASLIFFRQLGNTAKTVLCRQVP